MEEVLKQDEDEQTIRSTATATGGPGGARMAGFEQAPLRKRNFRERVPDDRNKDDDRDKADKT